MQGVLMENTQQGSFAFDDDEETILLHKLNLQRPLVFFDLETTGLDVQQDRIVQFAFLRVNPDRSQDEWTALVNPGIPIPVEASRVHHITNEQVADKPLFKEYAPLVNEFLSGCDLSGFNVAQFDAPFLQAEMERSGHPLALQGVRIVDAQVIYHKNEPRNLSAAYRFYCGREHLEAHDALADVRVTLEILDAQLNKYQQLPATLEALHKYCAPRDNRFVTTDRKFFWRHGEAVLGFGKHRGKTLQWLVENERDYLLWMKNGDFGEPTKALITNALNGVFPKKENGEEEE
jgi:DNA polymerase III subunit epsilon